MELQLSQPSKICKLFLEQKLPNRDLLVPNQQWRNENIVCNLFKINFKNTRMTNTKTKYNKVILVFLLLTLNRFYAFFWCFHCYLWRSNYQLGMFTLIWKWVMDTLIRSWPVLKYSPRSKFWFALPIKTSIRNVNLVM